MRSPVLIVAEDVGGYPLLEWLRSRTNCGRSVRIAVPARRKPDLIIGGDPAMPWFALPSRMEPEPIWDIERGETVLNRLRWLFWEMETMADGEVLFGDTFLGVLDRVARYGCVEVGIFSTGSPGERHRARRLEQRLARFVPTSLIVGHSIHPP
jgi:hypothetical protein